MRGKNLVFFILIIWVLPFFVLAQNDLLDSDGDGLTDEQETKIYQTNSKLADTDTDGYLDGEEIKHGYSPRHTEKKKMEFFDSDKDGINDALEIKFGTNLLNPDSDSDGYRDGEEIKHGYDPLDKRAKKLEKKIEIIINRQILKFYLGKYKLGEFAVSTGTKNYPTPLGTFKIEKKNPKAWSKVGRLWMPWWLSFKGGVYAIHELPVWPSGKKEGADHLGRPASHGCVRLGIGPAKQLYDWAEIGTKVVIKERE
jgi:hypothetical protein